MLDFLVFFQRYGRIREIDIKNQGRPPAFAFVVFDDYRDAEDAVHGRDGYLFDGARIRVEMARGGRGGDRGDRGDRGGYRDSRDDRSRTRTGGKRTEFGVVVSGLPRSCSWQDLKDFMRKAGDVAYADVDRRGEGFVDFFSAADMDRAIETLDNTEFKNPFDTCTIHVKAANSAGAGSSSSSSSSKRDSSADRGRDSRRRSHSRSRSGSGGRSRSRDRNGKGGASSRSPSPRRSSSRDRKSPSPARDD